MPLKVPKYNKFPFLFRSLSWLVMFFICYLMPYSLWHWTLRILARWVQTLQVPWHCTPASHQLPVLPHAWYWSRGLAPSWDGDVSHTFPLFISSTNSRWMTPMVLQTLHQDILGFWSGKKTHFHWIISQNTLWAPRLRQEGLSPCPSLKCWCRVIKMAVTRASGKEAFFLLSWSYLERYLVIWIAWRVDVTWGTAAAAGEVNQRIKVTHGGEQS